MFMTHGGLLGILEALHTGVPIIGLPLFFDQPRNVLKLVQQGSGILLDLQTITTDTLYHAINAIIHNNR